MRKKKFFKYIRSKLQLLGYKLSYMALLLYYAYQDPQTPRWAKNIVLGALGYLINPFDCIADITPVLGYTDDIGVLSFALVSIGAHISDEVIIQARRQLQQWWGDLDMDSIHSVENIL